MLPYMTVMLFTKIMATKKHRNWGILLLTLFLGNTQIPSMSKCEKYVTLIIEEKQ